MGNRRCRMLPGVDRDTKSTKIDFRPGSSALQMITNMGGVPTARPQMNAAVPAPTGFNPMTPPPTMKLGDKPCPTCPTMCPQCKPGKTMAKKYDSPIDKHCF